MQTINIQKLNLLNNTKVLDLGCGEGRHCFGAYMHANLDVYGFDLNPDDVQKAIDNFPQFNEKSDTKSCSFGCTDATKLPFADETFDYLICSEVLGHVRIFKYKQLRKMIEERNCKFIEKHREHALHSPYWWLKCLFWKNQDDSYLVNKYHDFLVWDMMKKPFITRFLEKMLQPLIGKSTVIYFEKN